MIYPIVAYGDPILRRKTKTIAPGTNISILAKNMIATMEEAQGIGLAAPQIGKGLRIFVAALLLPDENTSQEKRHNKVFVNPTLRIDDTVPPNAYDEGCLSIPGVMVPVLRSEKVTIKYFDEAWQPHEETYTGFSARILQHEYDHLEGKLHIDYAPSLKKRSLRGKLNDIRKGQVNATYEMQFII